MTDQSEDTAQMPLVAGEHDPAQYKSTSARKRFAVAKYYGMGSDGEWTQREIAEALDVSINTVNRYINRSQIGEETREVLATTEAEWRLDMALQLRKEVDRLEEIEQELLKRKRAVPTDYETRQVEGTPTGDHNIALDSDASSYQLDVPVPTDYEQITDYGPNIERVQKEKRQYLDQISTLLGLDAASKQEIDHNLASKHEEIKVVEYRDAGDEYPDPDVIDVDGSAAQVDEINATDQDGPDGSQSQ